MAEDDSEQSEELTGQEEGVEQPLESDEIIVGADGQPITRSQAWQIALQQGDRHGNVLSPDGTLIRRPKALRAAMMADFDVLAKSLESGMTENTRVYLDFCARMHRYSAGNQDLIFWQQPEATVVMGHYAWTKADYRVLTREEGGQPLFILQPIPFMKVRLVDKDGEKVEEKYVANRFKIALVYDVSSIDQSEKKVPTFFTPLQGSADNLKVKLLELIAEDGIKLTYGYVDMGAQGGSAGGEIIVRPDLPDLNFILVAAHEYFHEKLHKIEDRHKLDKQTKEVQAEMSTYLLCSYFGLPSPLSADYMRMYGATADILRANLKVSQEIVHETITRLEADYDLMAEFRYNPEIDQNRKQYIRKGKHKSRKK